MANRLQAHEGAVHVITYVVSGIGFLGAGVIMRGRECAGINTAGGATGADLILEALLGTIFVLTANTLLRPVVNPINRQPDDTLKRGDDQYGLCNHQT